MILVKNCKREHQLLVLCTTWKLKVLAKCESLTLGLLSPSAGSQHPPTLHHCSYEWLEGATPHTLLINFTSLPYIIAQLLANSRENEQGFRNQHFHWCLRQNVLTPKTSLGFSTQTHAQHLPPKTKQNNNLHPGLERGPAGFTSITRVTLNARQAFQRK